MDKVYYGKTKKRRLAYNAEIVDCDVCGKSLRRESLRQHKLSMTCKHNLNQCELCAKKVSYKTRDKHINSALRKIIRNINRYLELIGGYRCMDEKHIANGDVEFDGVIKLEPHVKTKYVNYK